MERSIPAALGLALALALITAAAPVIAFTEGKTLRILVGASPGGGYDTHARLVARQIGRHLPGNPKVVVQNMPGASGTIALNYLYNVVKPDGLTIAASLNGNYVAQLVGERGVQFDLTKVHWLGSTTDEVATGLMRSDTPFQSVEAIRGAKRPPNIGYGAVGSWYHQFPALLNHTLGLNIHLIGGYIRGTSGIKLAVERGELDGIVGMLLTSVNSALGDWVTKGYLKIFVQSGRWDPQTSSFQRYAGLKSIPTVWELAPPEHRPLITLVSASLVIGRPYVAPPKVAPDRVRLLRDAFWAAVNSAEYKKDARRIFGIDLNPTRGEALEEFMRKVMASSPEKVALFKTLVKK